MVWLVIPADCERIFGRCSSYRVEKKDLTFDLERRQGTSEVGVLQGTRSPSPP